MQHLAERVIAICGVDEGWQEEERNATILIVAGDEGQLPWEGLPVLINQPVCRMPSLVSLLTLHQAHAATTIDPTRVSYLLNPTKDLPATQALFEPYFAKQGWCGLSGCVPAQEQFRRLLEDNDLFVYVQRSTLCLSSLPSLNSSFSQLLRT